MSAKFCSNCGAPLEANAKFCGKCGAKVESLEEAQSDVKQQETENVVPQIRTQQQHNNESTETSRQAQGETQSSWQNLQSTTISANESASFSQEEAKSWLQDKINWYKVTILTTQGRLNRLAYFKYAILNAALMAVGSIAISIISGVIAVISEDLGLLVGFIFGIALIVPLCVGGIMLGIRRLHDFNLTGWAILLNFIPYVNIIFGLIVLFMPGTVGSNNYGEDPLAGQR